LFYRANQIGMTKPCIHKTWMSRLIGKQKAAWHYENGTNAFANGPQEQVCGGGGISQQDDGARGDVNTIPLTPFENDAPARSDPKTAQESFP